MIGGIDITISAPLGIPAADLADMIFKRLRRQWPEARFQDAEEDTSFPLDDPRVQLQGVNSTEFFIFENEDKAEAWLEEGAVPELSNTMLHFLFHSSPSENGGSTSVTLVCDKMNKEIKSLVNDLKESFFAIPLPRPDPSRP